MMKMDLKFEVFVHTQSALCELGPLPANTAAVRKAVEKLAGRTVPYDKVRYALDRLVYAGIVNPPTKILHGNAKPENRWRLKDYDAFKTKHMKFSDTIENMLQIIT